MKIVNTADKLQTRNQSEINLSEDGKNRVEPMPEVAWTPLNLLAGVSKGKKWEMAVEKRADSAMDDELLCTVRYQEPW